MDASIQVRRRMHRVMEEGSDGVMRLGPYREVMNQHGHHYHVSCDIEERTLHLTDSGGRSAFTSDEAEEVALWWARTLQDAGLDVSCDIAEVAVTR